MIDPSHAELQTAAAMQPPKDPPRVAAGFAGDQPEDIGREIIAMNAASLKQLGDYLRERITCTTNK